MYCPAVHNHQRHPQPPGFLRLASRGRSFCSAVTEQGGETGPGAGAGTRTGLAAPLRTLPHTPRAGGAEWTATSRVPRMGRGGSCKWGAQRGFERPSAGLGEHVGSALPSATAVPRETELHGERRLFAHSALEFFTQTVKGGTTQCQARCLAS